jgi:hypothetical protein
VADLDDFLSSVAEEFHDLHDEIAVLGVDLAPPFSVSRQTVTR